jgi:hypothetical protein
VVSTLKAGLNFLTVHFLLLLQSHIGFKFSLRLCGLLVDAFIYLVVNECEIVLCLRQTLDNFHSVFLMIIKAELLLLFLLAVGVVDEFLTFKADTGDL